MTASDIVKRAEVEADLLEAEMRSQAKSAKVPFFMHGAVEKFLEAGIATMRAKVTIIYARAVLQEMEIEGYSPGLLATVVQGLKNQGIEVL